MFLLFHLPLKVVYFKGGEMEGEERVGGPSRGPTAGRKQTGREAPSQFLAPQRNWAACFSCRFWFLPSALIHKFLPHFFHTGSCFQSFKGHGNSELVSERLACPTLACPIRGIAGEGASEASLALHRPPAEFPTQHAWYLWQRDCEASAL